MTLLIIFFVVSIVFSFACSIMEAVLLSITPSYVNRMESENPTLGATLKGYKKDIDVPLSAILTLNTIAHTVGAIGVGAQATSAFGNTPLQIPFINLSLSVESLIAGIMTLAILILSEIIPKTLGANYWRRLTPITLKLLRVIIFILKPFIWLSMFITKKLKSENVHSVLSREDYRAMTNLGVESGALEQAENKIIGNLLDLDAVQVKDVMTPRSVIHTKDENTSLQSYYDSLKEFNFSRIPIFSNSVDHLTGFVLKDEILEAIIEKNGADTLSKYKRPLTIIKQDQTLNEFFKEMSSTGGHMSAVVDSYGTLVGIVTMEDLLETILGFEIVDEMDQHEDLQEYARKRWEERARKNGLLKD